jgi:hypothetical protein
MHCDISLTFRLWIRERKMRHPTPPANSSPSLRVRISPRSRSVEPGTSGITLLDLSCFPVVVATSCVGVWWGC